MQFLDFLRFTHDKRIANLVCRAWFAEQQFPESSLLAVLQNENPTALSNAVYLHALQHDLLLTQYNNERRFLQAGYAALALRLEDCDHTAAVLSWLFSAIDASSGSLGVMADLTEATRLAFASVRHPRGERTTLGSLIIESLTSTREELAQIVTTWHDRHPNASEQTRLRSEDVRLAVLANPDDYKAMFVHWLCSAIDNYLRHGVSSWDVIQHHTERLLESVGL